MYLHMTKTIKNIFLRSDHTIIPLPVIALRIAEITFVPLQIVQQIRSVTAAGITEMLWGLVIGVPGCSSNQTTSH